MQLLPREVNDLLLLFPSAPGDGRLALRQLLDEMSWAGLLPGRCEGSAKTALTACFYSVLHSFGLFLGLFCPKLYI